MVRGLVRNVSLCLGFGKKFAGVARTSQYLQTIGKPYGKVDIVFVYHSVYNFNILEVYPSAFYLKHHHITNSVIHKAPGSRFHGFAWYYS